MEYIDHMAQAQFDYSYLQNSKLKFQKRHRAKPIYHYTSIGGLESILRNKTLRFTNIKYMNDKDEIIARLDSIAKDCRASEETRKQLRSAITNLGVQVFVCCFSLKEDSLPMWNYYTKEVNSQGYNIEFDDKKLIESILRSNPVLDGCYVSFGNVDYSNITNSGEGRNDQAQFESPLHRVAEGKRGALRCGRRKISLSVFCCYSLKSAFRRVFTAAGMPLYGAALYDLDWRFFQRKCLPRRESG